MSHKPYMKHGLFTGAYCKEFPRAHRPAVFCPPDKSSWQVLRYKGHDGISSGVFSHSLDERGEIALVLNDEESNFWPVISFLTREEAEALAASLLEAVKLT